MTPPVRRYAAATKVSPEKSRLELEQILARYGAAAFSYGHDQERSVVMFEAKGRRVRFDLATPAFEDFAFTPGRQRRSPVQQRAAWEQAIRQRWRALTLVVKAKLEAVEAGVVTFEEEFLAHILLPSGETVGQWAGPQLTEVYATGAMPAVLPGAVPRQLEAGGPR